MYIFLSLQCADKSDELLCLSTTKPCTNDQFACSDGHCIGKEDVCDGVKDCLDGDDEKDCATTSKDIP